VEVQGWNHALRAMSLGQRAKVTFGPELAFGDVGRGQDVPPGASVVYDLELLAINGRMAAITSAELDSYQTRMHQWAEGKLGEFDKDPQVAAKKTKKYETRDGYKDFLDGEVAKKMQSYEGAREFAELVASGGEIDKDEAANNTLRRLRIYLCPFGVCKHGMHDRGFLYLLTPHPMRELFFQGGYDQLGRRLHRSVFIEFKTLADFDDLLQEMPDMEVIAPQLRTTVQEYDPVQHVVVLFLAGDGYCNVLKMQLVPDYAICLNLAEDYVDKEKIELKID